MQSDRLKLFIDPFHGDPMGAAMFDHVLTLLLFASAGPIASVFTMDVHNAGAVQQHSVFGAYHRWWLGGWHEALAAALKDM